MERERKKKTKKKDEPLFWGKTIAHTLTVTFCIIPHVLSFS